MCLESQLLVCVNSRVKELLEKNLERARNKYVSRKKRNKQMQMLQWQQDTDACWILRDYKTFYLTIVRNKQGQFQCSFSGAKMSEYGCQSDVYENLEEAMSSMIEFVNEYVKKLNHVVSE